MDTRHVYDEVVEALELQPLLDRELCQMSGGELQRFAIGLTCVKQADVYLFDEISSFLDIRKRLQASKLIKSLTQYTKYVGVVEHDLSILDHISDRVCYMYGVPDAYGAASLTQTVRSGINAYLEGYDPTEKLRFRDEDLKFFDFDKEMDCSIFNAN